MPELPEVETVRRGLEGQVSGRMIKEVSVFWPSIIASSDAETFKQNLKNEKMIRVGRRGKFLLFYLSNWTLLSHLRMEGKYVLTPTSAPIEKHTHIIFHLDGQQDLRYLDVRKFGRMSLVPTGEEKNHPSLTKLGPEPTKETFHFETMMEKLKKHTKSIKAVLLDQSLVAGIGNIYADEVLFEAGIRPDRSSNSLKKEEGRRLYEAILSKMKEAVESGGTTIRTYQNSFGETGHFQDKLKVYGKKGMKCSNCGTPIEKTKVAQRGTHFCPHCQH